MTKKQRETEAMWRRLTKRLDTETRGKVFVYPYKRKGSSKMVSGYWRKKKLKKVM